MENEFVLLCLAAISAFSTGYALGYGHGFRVPRS